MQPARLFLTLAFLLLLPAACGTPADGGQVEQDFYLEVLFPQKDIIITIPYVVVEGRTSPDALVSVNGEIVDVSGEGYFSHGVRPPGKGHNTIEIVAYSGEGEQLSETRRVTWVAPPPLNPWPGLWG